MPLILMWICVALFLLKAIWNLGVPYAMIRETRRGERHHWSMFILIDVTFLTVAAISSAASGHRVPLGPLSTIIYGIAIIALAYINLSVTMIVGGLLCGLFREETDGP